MADYIPAWMGENDTLGDFANDYINTSADDLYSNVNINVDDSYWNDFWGGLNSVLGSNTTKNLLNFGSGIYGLFGADKMQNLSEKALKASDPFGPYRKQYGDQLLALMADPSSVTKLPGYQFQFDQGAEAVSRKMASKGYAGSGNMGTALTEYGQKFAENYFDTEANRLATLAGANISPNFNAGLGGYGSGLDTASKALASLGYGSVMASQQGTPRRPNAAGGEAAAVGNVLSTGGKLLAGLGANNTGGALSNAGGVISGLGKGGVGGYTQAAGSAVKLGQIASGTDVASRVGATGADPSGIGYVVPTAGTGGVNVSGAVQNAGDVASIYTGIQQGGVGGYAQAVGGAADLAGYNVPYLAYAGAAQKALEGDVSGAGYSAAITYAGPIAAIGSAIADFANKAGDKDSASVSSLEKYFSGQGWQLVGVRNRTWRMPDGRLIQFGDEAKNFARAAMNKAGDSELQSAWNAWMSTAKGG